MGSLEGKVALVTGATSGIGRRSVERFVEEGARVLFCGRRTELGASLENALGAERCRFMQADVTREADVERLIAACVETWGRIDCLSTTPADRRRWAASNRSRSTGSTPRWPRWCAASCSV